MPRLIALALLLANLLYFGWTLGWLDGLVGIRAQGDRDPQRLQRQLRPELVQLSSVDATVQNTTPTQAPQPGQELPAAAAAPQPELETPAVAASKPAAALAAVSASASASKPAVPAPVAVAASKPGVAASAAAGLPSKPVAVVSAVAPAASDPGTAGSAVAAAAAPSAPSAGSAAPSTPLAAPAAAASAPPDPVARVGPASAAAPGVEPACIEAGPFAAADVAAAETAVRSAAPLATLTQSRVAGGEWMIYMGPYVDEDALERKKSELSRIRGGPAYATVGPTPLFGLGLSLGRFPSKAEAERRLEQYRPRGIRTARVVPFADGPSRTMLRIAKADPALVARLAGIELPAGQNGFKSCASSR